MISVDNKLEDFIRKFPSLKHFLLEFKETQEQAMIYKIETIKNEFENKKENLIKEIKQWFDNNVVNFKVPPSHESKYSLENLDKDHYDYKLLEKCLTPDKRFTYTKINMKARITTSIISKNKAFNIYRVIPTDTSENQSSNSDGSKTLLLHGTNVKNIGGILKEGIKPSKSGFMGAGVYLSYDFCGAATYGKCYVKEC